MPIAMITDTQLLAVAKFQFSEQDKQVLSNAFSAPVNWKELLRKAQQHSVIAPFLLHLPQVKACVEVPKWVEDTLKKEAYLLSKNNHLLLQALMAMPQQVDGVPLIALKGSALNLSLYQGNLVRSMGDIDILVPYEQAQQVRDNLLKNGWKGDFVNGYKSKAHVREFERTQKTLPYIYQGNYAFFADLHFKFYNGPDDDRLAEIAWETAVPLKNGLFRLSNEMQLIHLSINFAKDWRYGVRLRSLCDVREMLLAYNIDWNFIDSLQLPEKVMGWCQFTWSAVETYYGVTVPAPYRERHRIGSLDNMARYKRRPPKRGIRAVMVKLNELKRQPYFGAYVWRTIVPTGVWLRHNYATSKVPLLAYWGYLFKRYVLGKRIRYTQ